MRGKGASQCKYRDTLRSFVQKKAKPVEIPFKLWARIGPGNYVLDGGSDPPWEGAIMGKGSPIVKYRDFLL